MMMFEFYVSDFKSTAYVGYAWLKIKYKESQKHKYKYIIPDGGQIQSILNIDDNTFDTIISECGSGKWNIGSKETFLGPKESINKLFAMLQPYILMLEMSEGNKPVYLKRYY